MGKYQRRLCKLSEEYFEFKEKNEQQRMLPGINRIDAIKIVNATEIRFLNANKGDTVRFYKIASNRWCGEFNGKLVVYDVTVACDLVISSCYYTVDSINKIFD